jgi:hypothetical protein
MIESFDTDKTTALRQIQKFHNRVCVNKRKFEDTMFFHLKTSLFLRFINPNHHNTFPSKGLHLRPESKNRISSAKNI